MTTDGHEKRTADELAQQGQDELTAEADTVRSKLLHTVEELDRRRHDALDVRLQIRRHALPLGAAAGVLVLSAVGVTAIVTHRIVTAQSRRRVERIRMLRRGWLHPDKVARRRPFFAELGRSILLGLLSAAVLIPARAGLKRLYG
jgi:hypothetical protein